MRIIQGIAQRKSEDTGWWGRQCFTGALWLSQLPLTHPSPRWGVRPSPAGWSARTASPEQVAGRRLRPAGSGCFEGCTFDEVNLGKYLLHLYHLFRDACIEALGLLLPWSIVLSITLIRVLNLPGTMYFSLIFNFFLPGSTAYTQNLSFKAKQKKKERKSKQGECQFDWWQAADSEGCSPSEPAQRGPVFAWEARSTKEVLRPHLAHLITPVNGCHWGPGSPVPACCIPPRYHCRVSCKRHREAGKHKLKSVFSKRAANRLQSRSVCRELKQKGQRHCQRERVSKWLMTMIRRSIYVASLWQHSPHPPATSCPCVGLSVTREDPHPAPSWEQGRERHGAEEQLQEHCYWVLSLELLAAFQDKLCLAKARRFCCKQEQKHAVLSLQRCTARRCLCSGGCVCECVCLCVYTFGEADEDYSGALGCFLCSRL